MPEATSLARIIPKRRAFGNPRRWAVQVVGAEPSARLIAAL
jgi:hypothetical protein